MVKNLDQFENLDEFPSVDVLQDSDPDLPITKVRVEGTVRTDEMPCRSNSAWKILKGSSPPEKVLNANPRRKLVVLQNFTSNITGATGEFILISRSKGDCDAFIGKLIPTGLQSVPYEFPWPDEMWARGVDITATGGTAVAFSQSTTDSLLSYATFDWSR